MVRKTLKEIPSWLVKIYKFNERLSPDGFMPNRTNLCHFCRVVFFWVPFKFAVATIVVGLASFGVLYLFFVLVPNTGWIFHWSLWSLITGAFVFWYLADNYKTPAQMWDIILDSMPLPPQWCGDIIDILWQWWFAIEDRICPLIELKDESDK